MASNDYIKFDGVEGEATDANHGGWIEVQNWSHGFDQPSSPTRASQGSTIERANHGDLNFTKFLDSSTDALLKACWSGKQFETVNMDCLKADGENTAIKYLEIKMDDVIVSNYGIFPAAATAASPWKTSACRTARSRTRTSRKTRKTAWPAETNPFPMILKTIPSNKRRPQSTKHPFLYI